MKFYNYILLSMMSLGMLCSCGDEDMLIGEEIRVTDQFLPDSNNHSEVAELRRSFYQKEKSYLLFNDTLRHEQVGVTASGEPFYHTETLDILYSVGSTNMYENNFVYKYLPTYDEEKESSDFLSKRILPHLGDKLRPFSWLLVDTIKKPLYEDVFEYPKVLSGERCVAIAVGRLTKAAEEEKAQLAQNLQVEVLSGALASKREMNEFYSFCQDMYDQFDFNYFQYGDHSEYTYTCGFLSKKKNPSTGMEMLAHPDKSVDVSDFLLLVFNSSDEEVQAKFENYPIVLKKYSIIKKLIVELGYVF